MYKINIYKKKLRKTWKKTSFKDGWRTSSRSSLGKSTPSYHDKYHYPMFWLKSFVKSLSMNKY
jgi:hypothetical protein